MLRSSLSLLALSLVACSGAPGTSSDAAVESPSVDAALDWPLDASADAASNYTDGICTSMPVSGGVLDPDCIYLIGTVLPGSAGRDVLIDLADPDAYTYGFGYYAAGGSIRRTDGRLLFSDRSDDAHIFGFTPDETPGSTPVTQTQMLVNDSVIATPQCALGPYRGLVFPDDGVVAYRCYRDSSEPESNSNRLFVEGESTPLVEGDTLAPVAVGGGRSALFVGTGTMAVFANGTLTPVSAGTFQQVLATRFLDGEFSVAIARSYTPTVTVELARVDLGGHLTNVATYNNGTVQSYYDDCKLAPDRTLVCFSYESSTDTVTRFSTTTAPIKIFDESEHSVQIHISSLATGS